MSLEEYIIIEMHKRMKANTMSCYALARNLGIKRTTIQFYLKGERKLPVLFIEEFCKYMNISIGELCSEYDRNVALQKNNSPL